LVLALNKERGLGKMSDCTHGAVKCTNCGKLITDHNQQIKQLKLEAGNLLDCIFYISQTVPEDLTEMTDSHFAALKATLAMAKAFSDEERAPMAHAEIARRLSRERK
jgi:hypothetical protein